jgi:very-short-patch-repair endonuclease
MMSRKKTLQDCHDLAASRGGRCLSAAYTDIFGKMDWACHLEHRWPATFNSIKNKGSWCPYCAGTIKHTISECMDFAKLRGGRCISIEYISAKTKMEWECHLEHRWFARFDDIKNDNNWCPYCSKRVKHTVDDCINFAKAKGGFCFSGTYVNLATHMTWGCNAGHRWAASFGNVQRGTWCPCCSEGKSQRELTDIIRGLFQCHTICSDFKGFDWLRTTGTGKQEFDIWIPELKLAIEYDGQQHFRPVRFGGISLERAKKQLKKVKQLDRLKNKKVKEHTDDVTTFVRFSFKEELTKDYVAAKLTKNGVSV